MEVANLEEIIANFVIQNKENYYRLAYYYVKNSADALDVVQEAIIKALSKKESLKNPDAIKTWFYQIVVHTALDLLRKQKRSVIVDDETLTIYDSGHTDHYDDMDLKKALDTLPIQYQSVIVLRYMEDLKINEIALVLNENANTVKTRLYKALNLLRIQLDEVEEGDFQ
ncbi:sigma-70 family RNA polymerase sigma factor [Neobacillus niacini]|uniref:RNA polymerase sigma factor n=1 Tax=Neobacillus niacini TaxID=86668 RepID=UPI002857110F|nr:sigma-70 family RNA polymerase sigma factor [Neobacillus niacini]MDR7002029.1 RNA polymerase sigma-70 factor (ECF subfamily) [Neobacillus niacini]